MQDYRLGLRMLARFPGLTLAGGLALAIAIGVGAGWYDVTREFLRPTLPLPGSERFVEVEMRNVVASEEERRLLHDFLAWRRDARSIVDLGAYRTLQRHLALGDAAPEPVTVAEITASAFRLAGVPPLQGRPLLDADELPGAAPVTVIGYSVWQRRFGAAADVVGQTLQLDGAATTIVGVMPEGFAFPVNHRLWVPLTLRPSGYAALEGPAIRVFGRLSPGATQAQANAELTTINERAIAESPRTHAELRPRVLAYGGESPGDRTWLELVVTHLPVLLVLAVACTNVGTLIYARTAAREAEIATRHALGAGRLRIVSQLFVEALVLAGVSAVVGLIAADALVKWGMTTYYAGQPGGAPFWLNPGLKLQTVGYAAALTVAGAALFGVLPALKVTRAPVLGQLRTAGGGGATLAFGGFWTTAMIGQIALAVVCLPAAMGISEEALRDRRIRDGYPAERYLAVQLDLEGADAAPRQQPESSSGAGPDGERAYRELERRILQEPGVVGITFGDRLPGMAPAVRSAEVEVAPAAAPAFIPDLWIAAAGPRYFETFDVAIAAGRDFHDGDGAATSQTAIVNEAFARRYFGGASPVGARVRYAAAGSAPPEPWFEIVGMVRDIGMTPTDLGEAAYLYRPASLHTVPLVMAVRTAGDPAVLAPRVRAIAAALGPNLRVNDIRSLDDHVWRVDLPMMVATGAIVAVVGLGLFLSAAGIFALMSVSVARRTREIGLRNALGASRSRVLAGVFSRALVIVGSGIAAGNAVILLLFGLSPEVEIADAGKALLTTSAVMLGVGLLACIEPARRALRIAPMEALKEAN